MRSIPKEESVVSVVSQGKDIIQGENEFSKEECLNAKEESLNAGEVVINLKEENLNAKILIIDAKVDVTSKEASVARCPPPGTLLSDS